jgi:hypothetical protein
MARETGGRKEKGRRRLRQGERVDVGMDPVTIRQSGDERLGRYQWFSRNSAIPQLDQPRRVRTRPGSGPPVQLAEPNLVSDRPALFSARTTPHPRNRSHSAAIATATTKSDIARILGWNRPLKLLPAGYTWCGPGQLAPGQACSEFPATVSSWRQLFAFCFP